MLAPKSHYVVFTRFRSVALVALNSVQPLVFSSCGLALSDLSKSPLLHVLHLVSPLEPKRRGQGGNVHFNQYTPHETVHYCEPVIRCYTRGPYLALSRGSIRFLFCRLLKRSLRTLPSGCRVTALQVLRGKRQAQTHPCETNVTLL